jgi:hypothetical protein
VHAIVDIMPAQWPITNENEQCMGSYCRVLVASSAACLANDLSRDVNR